MWQDYVKRGKKFLCPFKKSINFFVQSFFHGALFFIKCKIDQKPFWLIFLDSFDHSLSPYLFQDFLLGQAFSDRRR